MFAAALEFRHAWWLVLAPALWLAVWLLARRSLAGLGATTRRVAIALRFGVIALLASALADPVWQKTSEDVAVTIVMDVSRSVPPEARETAQSQLQTASGGAPTTGRVGVVSAAREALVQALPSERVRTIEVGDAGDLDATNLAAGVRLAMASAPEDAALRIVLVSDGNENVGSLLDAAQSARAAGVPIDAYVVGYHHESEVMLDELIAPATARRGETVNVRFLLTSNAPTIGRLQLTLNGQPVDLDPDSPGLSATVELVEGVNTVAVPVTLNTPGPQRFEAFYEPAVPTDDTLPQNNRQSSVTFVADQGRVLVFVGDNAEPAAEPIIRALHRADIATEVRPSIEGHSSLLELGSYDALVLIDVPAYDFSQEQQEELRTYVHDLGGGLVTVGGPRSFGAGGWIGSPLADALPVKLDPPQKRIMPRGALAIVLDSSGSMADLATPKYTKQQAANEASILAINALSRLDIVTVIRFSALPETVIEPMTVEQAGNQIHRIRNIGPSGGTHMYSAMERAHELLRNVDAAIKHVILLTDGQSAGSMNEGVSIAHAMARDRITLSTVALGEAAAVTLLQELARIGGGESYVVTTQNQLLQLPQIFIKEAQTLKRALIWEGDPITPTVINVGAEAMRGIDAVPPVSGYIVTADREGLSLVSLRGEQDDPLLAQWQYGLGRSVAFMSDAATRWSPAWPAWEGAQAFWAQHVRWAMRPSGSSNLTVYTERQGDDTVVVVEALNSAGERMNFARFTARVVTPELGSETLALRQAGPGRYEGRFKSQAAGSYLVNLRYDAPRADGEGVERGSAQIAVSRSFAEEHRALRDNLPLLRQVAQVTGGRVITTQDPIDSAFLFDSAGLTMPVRAAPIWLPVALAALVLFLIDAGVRRVRVDVAAILAAVRRALGKRKAASEQQIGALRAARERTQEKLARRRAGEAVAMGGMSHRSEIANAKFEADQSAPAAPPLEKAPLQRVERAAVKDVEEDEAGMSRLMRAKRRAREEMDENT